MNIYIGVFHSIFLAKNSTLNFKAMLPTQTIEGLKRTISLSLSLRKPLRVI